MKRKYRKTVHYLKASFPKDTSVTFPKGTASLWLYNQDQFEHHEIEDLSLVQFKGYPNQVIWFNVYGLEHAAIPEVIAQNHLDEFLINLTKEDNHRNKVIELDNCFFFSLKTPAHIEKEQCIFEQLLVVVSKNDGYIWTLQELQGDHFEHIRERITKNVGIVRKKSSDYLFYLLLEAVIDNYYTVYERLSENNKRYKDFANVRATPAFAAQVETNRTALWQIKKTASALRDALTRLEALEFPNFNPKYLIELKEQISYLNDAIDYSGQQLESSINLIINIQNNRLNEVMRTLTIFSVLFIPLTFIAGI